MAKPEPLKDGSTVVVKVDVRGRPTEEWKKK